MREFTFSKSKVSEIKIEGQVYEIDCGNIELIKECARLEKDIKAFSDSGDVDQILSVIERFIEAVTRDYKRLHDLAGGNIASLMELTKALAGVITEGFKGVV